jgi:acetolactate synthase-1/2/3 large subunit
MPKSKRPTQAKPAAADKRAKPVFADMSTGEATAATLLAHGLDTVYALPGVHNDHLFDAFQRAGDALRVVHTRHEQGAAYMALGAALATGKPQTYVVVPGPGLLNSAAALLTAYGMNAPVLALIGQIPAAALGRGFGHLHEIRDQAGIIARLVDHSARIDGPAEASAKVAKAIASMSQGRPGPAALECAMDVWGKRGPVTLVPPAPARARRIDEDAVRAAAKLLGKAKRVLIVAGGGAQDASPEVTLLSDMLQAPVLAYRRGRGVLDGRSPFSVTLPLGRELWGEADAVLGVGTRLLNPMTQWGVDRDLQIVRVDADREEPARYRKPKVALIGDAAPVLQRLIDALAKTNARRPSRRDEMQLRQAKLRQRLGKIGPQLAFVDVIRAELPEDGIYVDEVTQVGFAARLAFPAYRPRTFLSPGYQDNLGWGYATALGAQHARADVPVLSINGDGGFLYTGNELATAMRHRIPLVAVVFTDGAFGNVRRIQQEQFGNRVIASDLANPDFVKYAESFGAAGRRARTPAELGTALKAALAAREPTLIEVPVGPMPSPWEFIHMPRVRGL